METKKIYTVCLPCGNKHKTKEKSVFGVWIGECDLCGDKNVSVAAAGHDFGIYNSEEEKVTDSFSL